MIFGRILPISLASFIASFLKYRYFCNMSSPLSIQEIQSAYPDQWVLLGNPLREGATLVGGFVICHGMEKRDLLAEGMDWRTQFETATAFFTGVREKGRRFLL